MNNGNLYNSPFVANRIKEYAKIKKVSLKDILNECELGSNTFSHMLHGKSIAFNSLALIADCLGCSVDYLLGRVSADEQDILQNYHKISPAAKKQIHMIIDNEINAAETVPASSDDALSQILDTEKGYAQVAAHGGDGVKTIKVANENELDSINDI